LIEAIYAALFLTITDGILPRPLDEGLDLPNDYAAWEEATTLLRRDD
jgi:hypothetical protein